MKRTGIAALLLLALGSLAAHASVKTTPGPPSYELHSLPDNKLVPGPWPTSEQSCADMGRALAEAGKLTPKWACIKRQGFETVATCEDEPAPRIYLSLVDLQDGGGSKGYELPEMEPPTLKPGSDVDFMPERDWLYVHNSAWPAGYPACWVRGWDDPFKWRANSVKDPGKVFLELITPQNAADVYELPNTIEPVPTPAGFDEEWQARQDAAAAACAAGDVKQCPQVPNKTPGACGWYWETACGGPGVPPGGAG